MSFERLRAIASSTALSCFSSSSRRVLFFELADEPVLPSLSAGDRFFEPASASGAVREWSERDLLRANEPFLLLDFLSLAVLSLDRTRSRDEPLELDEYDDSLSEPLESEEPATEAAFRYMRLANGEHTLTRAGGAGPLRLFLQIVAGDREGDRLPWRWRRR